MIFVCSDGFACFVDELAWVSLLLYFVNLCFDFVFRLLHFACFVVSISAVN